jgi:hypothetical protein
MRTGSVCRGLCVGLLVAMSVGPVAHAGAHPVPARALVRFTTQPEPIPAGFEGVSFEYNELPRYAHAGPPVDRALSLIHPNDGRRLLLRVGGQSADRAWWHTAGPVPTGGLDIRNSWLTDLGGLTRRDHLDLLLDVNLAVHSPKLAVAFLRAVGGEVGAGVVEGAEIGNEPNLYPHETWLVHQRTASTERGLPFDWPAGYGPLAYHYDYLAYARALRRVFPGLELGGPNITSAQPDWLSAVENLGPMRPDFISLHRYPLSTCWPRHSAGYPTIGGLLSERASRWLADSVGPALAAAGQDRAGLRLSEINAVSCPGGRGVADSFATALWAADTLPEFVRAGVRAVNWHIRPHMLNAPFDLNHGRLTVRPELYGLILFAALDQASALLSGGRVTGPEPVHLKAWQSDTPRNRTILLINKGAADVTVTIPTDAQHPAGTLRRLIATGINATGGVTYAGRWVGPDGRWHGPDTSTTIHSRRGAFHLTVRGYSAITLTAPASSAGPDARERPGHCASATASARTLHRSSC